MRQERRGDHAALPRGIAGQVGGLLLGTQFKPVAVLHDPGYHVKLGVSSTPVVAWWRGRAGTSNIQELLPRKSPFGVLLAGDHIVMRVWRP